MSSDSSKAQPGDSAADLTLVTEPVSIGDGPPAEASEPNSFSQTGGESDERQILPVWLFVSGLIIAAVVIGWQARLAGELVAEVAVLEQQLERSHALLEAHRNHLGEIRGGVTDLSERLAGLRKLVAEGPVAPAAPTIRPLPPSP
ncbi:MAG: hypothetical protein VCB25_07185 [Myxococcota bacterium]